MADLTGKIVFTSGQLGDTDLWRLDLVSGELKQLTVGKGRNAKGRWSPDGRRIVYVSDKLGPSDLWMMDADGQDDNRLTTDGRWYDHPDWSPDGQRIVCCSNREGAADNELWIHSLADGKWQRLTRSDTRDSYPVWSPDGRRIAFSSARSGSDDIWVMELASGAVVRLTDAPGRDFAPAWSPDGKQIAFVADRAVTFLDRLESDPDLDIWLMNADGTEQSCLTANQGTDRCVAWSPDGQCLVYSASRSDTGERLHVLSLADTTESPLEVARQPLEDEIGAQPLAATPDESISPPRARIFGGTARAIVDVARSMSVGLFNAVRASRRMYPDSYFGTETYPHWSR